MPGAAMSGMAWTGKARFFDNITFTGIADKPPRERFFFFVTKLCPAWYRLARLGLAAHS